MSLTTMKYKVILKQILKNGLKRFNRNYLVDRGVITWLPLEYYKEDRDSTQDNHRGYYCHKNL